MPDETRNYVPKLQAVKNIVLNPAAFQLALPALENHPYFLGVPIERDIDVALAVRLAGVSMEDFQALNPQHDKPVVLAAGTPQILLPYDNANRFVQALEAWKGPTATWTAWVAPRTLKPADAAKAVGMSEAELRQVNRIPPRMLVRAGSTLLVPRKASMLHDVAEHIADNGAMLLAPEAAPQRRRTVRANKGGETVVAAARRLGVSAAQLAQWNGVTPTARFRGGQPITLVVSGKPPRSAKPPVRATAKPATKAGTPRAAKPAAAARARQSAR
jgi:membrane-bound lytic murein transglycosylase D